jgi:hypothetical protein
LCLPANSPMAATNCWLRGGPEVSNSQFTYRTDSAYQQIETTVKPGLIIHLDKLQQQSRSALVKGRFKDILERVEKGWMRLEAADEFTSLPEKSWALTPTATFPFARKEIVPLWPEFRLPKNPATVGELAFDPALFRHPPTLPLL